MKKIYLLIIGLLLTITAVSTMTYAYASSDWTLTGGYYYYNKEVNPYALGSGTIRSESEHNILEIKMGNEWVKIDDSSLLYQVRSHENTVDFRVQYRYSSNGLYEFVVDQRFTPEVRYKKFVKPTNPSEFNTVDDLKETSGNPFKSGDMGFVDLDLTGTQLDISIVYNGEDYYLRTNLSATTDLTPFNFNNAFYYTYQGSKYLLMNHHASKSMILGTAGEEFVPYTIWNLNTDEIHTLDKLDTYFMADYRKTGFGEFELFGYFYLDNFIIDNLSSLTVSYEWAFNYHIMGQGDWRKTAYTIYNTDLKENRDHLFQIYKGLFLNNREFADDFFDSDISNNPISKMTENQLDSVFLSQLNRSYRSLNNNFDGIKDTLDIYRVSLATKRHVGAKSVSIYNDINNPGDNNPRNFNLIEFTYVKDGKITKVVEGNINFYFDPGRTQRIDKPSLWDNIASFLAKWIIIIYVIAWVWFGFKNKLFKDTKTALMYSAAGVGILILFGIIL